MPKLGGVFLVVKSMFKSPLYSFVTSNLKIQFVLGFLIFVPVFFLFFAIFLLGFPEWRKPYIFEIQVRIHFYIYATCAVAAAAALVRSMQCNKKMKHPRNFFWFLQPCLLQLKTFIFLGCIHNERIMHILSLLLAAAKDEGEKKILLHRWVELLDLGHGNF